MFVIMANLNGHIERLHKGVDRTVAETRQIFFFAKAKREQGQPLFKAAEQVIFGAVVLTALFAAYALYSGIISL